MIHDDHGTLTLVCDRADCEVVLHEFDPSINVVRDVDGIIGALAIRGLIDVIEVTTPGAQKLTIQLVSHGDCTWKLLKTYGESAKLVMPPPGEGD